MVWSFSLQNSTFMLLPSLTSSLTMRGKFSTWGSDLMGFIKLFPLSEKTLTSFSSHSLLFSFMAFLISSNLPKRLSQPGIGSTQCTVLVFFNHYFCVIMSFWRVKPGKKLYARISNTSQGMCEVLSETSFGWFLFYLSLTHISECQADMLFHIMITGSLLFSMWNMESSFPCWTIVRNVHINNTFKLSLVVTVAI